MWYIHHMISEIGEPLTDKPEGFYTRGTRRGFYRRVGEYEVNVTVDRARRTVEIGENLLPVFGNDTSIEAPNMPDDIRDIILPKGAYRHKTVDRGILALISAYSEWRVNAGPLRSQPNLSRFLENLGPRLGDYLPKE